ncbi:MAG TPA: nitroreductase family deazaflavin-dependent oxidoreductase [Acidimicrobiia bacterium]|nr:nitroreductase family deazaflavin-dependent oxidoreductase [Acidimicrobiia bacterium]
MDVATVATPRNWFKLLNRWMIIPMWRLGLGGFLNIWPAVGGRMLVLVHTGRKSGRRRLTPLNYAPSPPSSVFVLAGSGAGTDWYQNALANTAVEVWLPDGRWLAEAVDVSDHPLRPAILRDVLIGSGFAAPLAGVDPRRLSDHELEEKTAGYRLLELQHRADATGTHGPGDLSWIWVAAGALWVIDRARRR